MIDLKQTGNRSKEEAQKVIGDGYPPIARDVILVDFDGTLFPFGYLFDYPEPIEGAVEFMQGLKTMGYTVGIFTSRLSSVWLRSVKQTPEEHIIYITEICKRYEIPFDFITAEKMPAIAYIDDRAIQFKGNFEEIMKEL